MLVTFLLLEGFLCLLAGTFRPWGAPLWLERHRGGFRPRLACSFWGILAWSLRRFALGAPLALAGHACARRSHR